MPNSKDKKRKSIKKRWKKEEEKKSELRTPSALFCGPLFEGPSGGKGKRKNLEEGGKTRGSGETSSSDFQSGVQVPFFFQIYQFTTKEEEGGGEYLLRGCYVFFFLI